MYARKLILSAALVGLAMAAVPNRAAADWYVTPFIGANFGGNADFGDLNDFDDSVEQRLDVGAGLGWMGGGIAGFELDFGWSPNFFEDTAGDANFAFGDSNVTTLMGNLVVGVPVGGQTGPGIRPYGTAGVGLIRAQVDGGQFFNDLDTNDFGFNIGGGVQGYFTDNIGLRGDVRYFRSFNDDQPDDEFDLAISDFDFWRATVGVMFRFGN